MNKKLTKIVGAALGLSMAVGVGVGLVTSNNLASPVYADDPSVSTLNFTAACGGSGVADDGAEWTITSDGTESTFDNTKGIHYGTSSAQVGYIQLATDDISGTISKVVVNASTASGVTASVNVTIGGVAFGGDAQSLSQTASNYTFSGSAAADEIVVKIEKPSKAAKAIYCKSVAVTYSTSGETTYSVLYDGNGGTGTMTDNTAYSNGATVTVLDNEFVRDGYIFDHWDTKDDDTGIDYDEGGTFSIGANVTLYAQWERNLGDLTGDGLIKFGSDTGSLDINSTSVSGTDSSGVIWTVDTTFASGTSFSPNPSYSQIGSKDKPASSITFETEDLLSNYKVKAFTAKLGGFNNTIGDVTLKVGDTVVGTGSLSASDDVTVSKSITAVGSKLSVIIDNIDKGVKAYFISYTLAPEIETQTLSYSVASAYDDEEIIISSDAESAVTWSIVSGSGTTAAGAEITSGGVVSVDGPGTVTVKATAAGYSDATIQVTFIEKPANAHTVTFVSNGGSVSPAAKVIADQGTFEFPSAGTKTGYVFDGWTSTGSAPYHAVGETSPAVTDDITYTAHWTEVYEHTVYFGTADGTAPLSNFTNTSYIIPSEVTLDNIQGNVYGKNDNTAAAIRLGKGDATGSFDVTIDSDYYIKKVVANLKYYSSDSTAEFAVSPNAEYSVKKAGLTNNFADYEFDVSEAFSNKVTFSNTITGKRVYISGFTIEYDIKPSSVAAIKAIDTASALKFNYTDSITNIESFTNTAIRFGGFMSKALWDSLAADVDIEGYGILVAANSGLDGETIKQKYASAKTTSNTPEQAISALSTHGVMKNVQHKTHPTAADDGQKSFMNVSGDYYVWTVKKTIGSEFTAKYNAVAFILIDGGIVFLDEVSYSAKDIATRDVPNTDAADPALPALTWIKDH